MGKRISKENTHPITRFDKLVPNYEGDVIGDKRVNQLDPSDTNREPRDLKCYL